MGFRTLKYLYVYLPLMFINKCVMKREEKKKWENPTLP